MELDKEQGLEANSLNDLDNESTNDDHVQEPTNNKPQQDLQFDNGEQSITYGDLAIHLTAVKPERACELFVWLYNELNKQSSKTKSMPGVS